jgi:hypothetical protein
MTGAVNGPNFGTGRAGDLSGFDAVNCPVIRSFFTPSN